MNNEEKFSLGSDNHSGVHPLIWEKISALNHGHSPSYGMDALTARTTELVKDIFGRSADPYFVFNGTAANVMCLRAFVESHEAVICADTAHLNMDECGAPEYAIGCKLLSIPSLDGKIHPRAIEPLLVRLGDQHFSQPRMVSITQPTELGTVYSLAELKNLREFTKQNNLLLHIDGARLIYAAHYLKCELKDLAENLGVDALSFGGTKNGLLFGEIVLLFGPQPFKKAKFIRKQLMQLPSKMRFLSGQFSVLLQNNLWQEVARHGHELALYLADQLAEFDEIQVTQKVQANSVFAKIPKRWVKKLREKVFFYVWDENEFVVRLMISFDAVKKDMDQFIQFIREVKASGENAQ